MAFNQYARNENENAKFVETDAGQVAVRVVGSSGSTSTNAIISTPKTMTGTVADVGSEIDVRGYKTLNLYITSTINLSNDLRLAFMAKHESAGAEEMPLDEGFVTIAGTTITSPSTAALYYFEQTEDVDADMIVSIDVSAIAYLQVRAFVGTVGATPATIDTLDAIKQN